jgi:iron(III) transport system substrate-binding protein
VSIFFTIIEQVEQLRISEWLPSFFNPQKRIFWGYLLSSLLIALLWLRLVKKINLRKGAIQIFGRHVWTSHSALADYKVMLINSLLFLLLSPRLLAKATIAYIVFNGMHALLDGRPYLTTDLPDWTIAFSFTLSLFVVDDFARYWLHRWLHTAPILWSFHKVHHSATALNPFTVFRTHPIEAVLFSIRNTLVQGITTALFFFFFGDQVTLMMVLGASIFTFAFNLLGANLRHSPVPIRYWKLLECIIMSPAQHHIHHSTAKEHINKNFGVALSVWDWIFGSLCLSKSREQLNFGLSGKQSSEYHSLKVLYLEPIHEAGRVLLRFFFDHFQFIQNIQYNVKGVHMRKIMISIFLVGITGTPTSLKGADQFVNIYSARKEALILPLLKRFKKESGINYRLVTGKADGLLKRLEIEGSLSPADLFITVDAGRLQRAKQAGVLQPIDSPTLKQRIPSSLRDRENYWFGMSQRARTIIYNMKNVDTANLSTYEDLASPAWKGKLCIRSSGSVYNQSLVASMIEVNGIKNTESWARGLVQNFARPPTGGDTDLLKATAAGQCDIALANTYYLGRMINSKISSERKSAQNLSVFWPNQGEGDRGVHVNVSGAGVTKYARNKKEALSLLEFLVTDESQEWYAEINNEYPVVKGAGISKTLESFGTFKADSINLTILGVNNPAAVKLMDRAGWR